MKRTTIYLAPDLEVRLKREVVRRGRPMAEIVREAVEVYLTSEPAAGPPGAGAFASGRTDTAERTDEILAETGFGGPVPNLPKKTGVSPKRAARRPAKRQR